MDAIDRFLAFTAQPNPRCIMTIPKETSYEEMVRKYLAGDAGIVQTMKYVLPKDGSSTAEEELARWKQYAKDERAALRDEVPMAFSLGPPPAEDDLAALTEVLDGASPALVEFYRRHEGGGFFMHGPDGDDGLFFLPIEAMPTEQEDLLVWYEGDDEPFEEDIDGDRLEILGLPDWYDDAIVFGMVGCAAERFLLPTTGAHRGSIFLFDHDPQGMLRLAKSFEDFLDWLIADPVRAAELTGLHGIKRYQTGA